PSHDRQILRGASCFKRSGDKWAIQIGAPPDVSLVRSCRHRLQPTGMEFRHATSRVDWVGVSGLPHPRRRASALSTCRVAGLCRLGPLPPFPRSLVKGSPACRLVYCIGLSFCCRPHERPTRCGTLEDQASHSEDPVQDKERATTFFAKAKEKNSTDIAPKKPNQAIVSATTTSPFRSRS